MPLAKIRSARSRISSLVTVLLMTRRSRSDPVSGAMVIVRLAARAEDPDDRLGEVVEPERRRADAVAHLVEPREDALDVRVVAERDRHQADAVRVDAARARRAAGSGRSGNARTGR